MNSHAVVLISSGRIDDPGIKPMPFSLLTCCHVVFECHAPPVTDGGKE